MSSNVKASAAANVIKEISKTTTQSTKKPKIWTTSKKDPLHSLVRQWDTLPQETPASLESARRIFAQETRFAWSASALHILPPPSVPEIAFLGCSNVGKSTLLNVLVGRKRHKLVRTSSKPGATKTLNGFQVGRDLCLVDTPGYGYRSRDAWGPLMMEYLRTRKSLRRTCVLVEASHGFKAHDEALVRELAAMGVPFQVILTKVDKLVQKDLDGLLQYSETFLKKHGRAAVWGQVMGVSSDDRRLGIPQLRSSLAQAAGLLDLTRLQVKGASSRRSPASMAGSRRQEGPLSASMSEL